MNVCVVVPQNREVNVLDVKIKGMNQTNVDMGLYLQLHSLNECAE